MHSSLTVADYLLDRGKNKKNADQQPITLKTLQLIKLVYLCHGWMLGLYGKPLLVESVEVWRYGPVIAAVYRVARKFTSNTVVGPLTNDKGKFTKQEQSVMNQVFDVYGKFTGEQLSTLTHAPKTPWSEMEAAGREIIPNDLIQKHFSELAQQQK